jgi:chemotaxis protein CheC
MEKILVKPRQKDALQEAGNIAAGYAVNALSKLIDERIMIDVTKCKLVQTENINKAISERDEFVVAINMLIPMKNLCSVLMFIPYEAALEYCDKFTHKEAGTTKQISYKEFVVLAEIGTISLCAYLNALSKLLSIRLLPTPPAVACDVISSILEDVAPSADTIKNNAIVIKTKFELPSNEHYGIILFIPDRDSKHAIFRIFNT